MNRITLEIPQNSTLYSLLNFFRFAKVNETFHRTCLINKQGTLFDKIDESRKKWISNEGKLCNFVVLLFRIRNFQF
jgi:hypothetical protein